MNIARLYLTCIIFVQNHSHPPTPPSMITCDNQYSRQVHVYEHESNGSVYFGLQKLFAMMDKCKTAKEKQELGTTIKQLQQSIDSLKVSGSI